mmetsp:Transcript_31826/g.43428  ORF Transcript_31826/g.43428 Transcript_31826/m.43428 type:complete len:308 (-) Transcript_31826:97-1020(-)
MQFVLSLLFVLKAEAVKHYRAAFIPAHYMNSAIYSSTSAMNAEYLMDCTIKTNIKTETNKELEINSSLLEYVKEDGNNINYKKEFSSEVKSDIDITQIRIINANATDSYYGKKYIEKQYTLFQNLLRNMDRDSLIVVMMMGIPGSGKTTIARMITNIMNDIDDYDLQSGRLWLSFNQDALKNRGNVVVKTREALQEGYCVVIDRCNIDAQQRSHWIELAYQFNAFIICVIVPDSMDVQVCAPRATLRGDDGLHDEDTNWFRVCRSMQSSFQRPELNEGIHAIYPCVDSDGVTRLLNALAHFRRGSHS